MFCSTCGKELQDKAKFCTNCGNPIKNDLTEETRVKNILETKENISESPQLIPTKHSSKTVKVILIVAAILVGITILIVLMKPNDVKIIPPNYMDKGSEALINKNYQEAISFFEKVNADSKDYQEAQNQIKYARGMIIQAELDRYESSKDLTGLDNFTQRYSGTEYEQKANDTRNRLMDYFHTRQSQFESKQVEFAEQYTSERNDVARSNTFNESNRWSADFMKEDNYRFYDWQGTLLTLSTTKGGNEVHARIQSHHITYVVKLTSSSPAYQKLASVNTFEKVRFSGIFQVGANGFLQEDSVTEVGRMINPEFKIQLTDIAMDDGSTAATTKAEPGAITQSDQGFTEQSNAAKIKINSTEGKILSNSDYRIETGKAVKLKNGLFEEGSINDDNYITVGFEDFALGDLNNDGVKDAGVVLSENSGGSGSFHQLFAMINDKGQFQQKGEPVGLGDRVKINFIVIKNRRITIDMIKWRIRSKSAPHSGASRHPNPEHAGR